MIARKRLAVGFGAGILGTVAMSIVMIATTALRVSPIPKPIPIAIIAALVGSGAPKVLLILLASGSHLGYGGIWGAAFAAMSRQATVLQGLGLGVLLWLIMQIVVFPALGWGVFALALTPKIALATLILHLIYGATTGYALQRFLPPDSTIPHSRTSAAT